ncbi:hypothetical protein ZWY2020_001389 [Hordeum vulgare]|nr:hypothetical protein ZWY2020_001389 [Hordeum vulgare]
MWRLRRMTNLVETFVGGLQRQLLCRSGASGRGCLDAASVAAAFVAASSIVQSTGLPLQIVPLSGLLFLSLNPSSQQMDVFRARFLYVLRPSAHPLHLFMLIDVMYVLIVVLLCLLIQLVVLCFLLAHNRLVMRLLLMGLLILQKHGVVVEIFVRQLFADVRTMEVLSIYVVPAMLYIGFRNVLKVLTMEN